MWLPAMLLITAGLLAAAGFGSVTRSDAASSGSGTVDVEVLPNLVLDGTCPGGAVSGPLSVGANDANIGSTCLVEYSTNNHAGGVRLRLESTRPTAPALCKESDREEDCDTAAAFGDAPAGGIADMDDGDFGVQVAARTCTTTPVWNVGTTYGIPEAGAPETVCASHPMGSTGSYQLQFRADTTAAQEAGDYYAGVRFFLEAV